MLGPLLKVQMWFCVAGARDSAPCQKWAKREGFCSISKNDGRCGTFEEDLKDAFRVACAVQETCSSEMLGGQGADFLRGVALWSIKSSGLLRWFCVTGAALRMTWHHFFVAGAALYTGVEKSQNAFGRRQSDLPFLKEVEVSQNFLVFDVVIVEDWGSLALPYTTPITRHHSYNCNYTTLITPHYNYNSTTLQLQLHYTTLHPAVVGEVATATIAATPKNTTPTTFRSISGFALPSVIDDNQPLL